MTKFSVDLKTKIIADDTQVFFARAGEQGHLFEQVLATKAIGPDLPALGLDLSKGLDNETHLIAKINRARKIRGWCQSSAAQRAAEAPPTTNINSYSNDKKSSGHAQIEGVVSAYFQDMRAGDILIIPNPSIVGNALIVELLPLGKKTTKIPGVRRFDGFDFDGRPFGHFRQVPMTEIPRHIIEISRRPGVVARITLPQIRERLFELCYDDYSLDDIFSSKITTTKPEFRPFDANVLNAFVQMVAYNFERLEEGAAADKLIGLKEAAFLLDQEPGLAVKIDINSPGHMSIIDRSIAPLVAGALFAILASVGFDSAAIAQDTIEVIVQNSQIDAALDLCSAQVSQRTNAMLQLMPEADFQELCNLLRETVDATGAKTSVTAKPTED